MYECPLRRPGDLGLAGAHARQIPADFHQGSYRDFLRRHEWEAGEAASGTRQRRTEFAGCLLPRAADHRNLMCAIDHLTREGDKAPGPNCLRLERLDTQTRWNLCRALRNVMLGGTYRPGKTRRIWIPKTSGTGTRPLDIANHDDLVIQRGIAQVIEPLIDPMFDPLSFGYRPGLGREHALASVELLSHRLGSYHWVAADIKDAFTQIPHERLLDVLRRHGLPDNLVALIGKCIANRNGRGIPQGGCLSPFLLNVYLDWFLDRVWRKRHPDIPLIRVADDILLICRSQGEARDAYDSLRNLLLPAGMPLKGDVSSAVCDLDGSQAVGWLGYRIGKQLDQVVARIGTKCWTSLALKLEEAHFKTQAPLRAIEAVLGWVDQLGPCRRHEDTLRVLERVCRLAAEHGFKELPSQRELLERWNQAYVRYRCLRRAMYLSEVAGLAGGSADRHPRAANSRGGGAPTPGAPSPSFSSISPVGGVATLYVDGACDLSSRVGGWAFCLRLPDTLQPVIRAGSLPRTTNNRMELLAVIRGLEALDRPSRVHVVTDSRYAFDGLTRSMQEWQRRRWRRSGGGQLANVALWRRLADLIETHDVTCEWVRGHSGNPGNELCDRLAGQAVQDRLAGDPAPVGGS